MGVSPLPYSFKHWLLTEAIRRPRPAVPIPLTHTSRLVVHSLCVHLFGQPPASVHTPAPPDPAGRSRARRRPARARARRPPAHAPRLRRLPPARVPPRLHRLSQLHAAGR